MIKAIIFDSGGVVINQDRLLNRFMQIFKSKDKEKFLVELNLRVIPLCKNELSESKFWTQFAKGVGISPSRIQQDLWTKAFEKLTKINKGIIKIIKTLKPNYKLALISNSIKSHAKINRKRGIYDLFDVVVLSHEVGLTKDSKKIFLLAANKLKVIPKECIFIDDIKEFVDVAESAGMNGIVFKNEEQLKANLKRIIKHEM